MACTERAGEDPEMFTNVGSVRWVWVPSPG